MVHGKLYIQKVQIMQVFKLSIVFTLLHLVPTWNVPQGAASAQKSLPFPIQELLFACSSPISVAAPFSLIYYCTCPSAQWSSSLNTPLSFIHIDFSQTVMCCVLSIWTGYLNVYFSFHPIHLLTLYSICTSGETGQEHTKEKETKGSMGAMEKLVYVVYQIQYLYIE